MTSKKDQETRTIERNREIEFWAKEILRQGPALMTMKEARQLARRQMAAFKKTLKKRR